MSAKKHQSFGLLFFVLLLVGCGGEEEAVTGHSSPAPTLFDPMGLEISDPHLIKAREAWMATCAGCHLTGLGGAPKIGDKDAWAPRIAKGKEVLYDHAINGFVGPLYHEMPAKGGYPELTDEEVKLGVDFVVFASQ